MERHDFYPVVGPAWRKGATVTCRLKKPASEIPKLGLDAGDE